MTISQTGKKEEFSSIYVQTVTQNQTSPKNIPTIKRLQLPTSIIINYVVLVHFVLRRKSQRACYVSLYRTSDLRKTAFMCSCWYAGDRPFFPVRQSNWEIFNRNFLKQSAFLKCYFMVKSPTMCFKSANRYQKLLTALENLSFDFACDKIGSCLKYLKISWYLGFILQIALIIPL